MPWPWLHWGAVTRHATLGISLWLGQAHTPRSSVLMPLQGAPMGVVEPKLLLSILRSCGN